MSIFAKFNEQVDLTGIKEDIVQAGNNDQEYEDVPVGQYEVAADKIEVVMTKSEPARPMLTIWFRVLDGKYKNQRIFYNQVLLSKTFENAGMLTSMALEMLRQLESNVEVKFEDYDQLAQLAIEIATDIEGKKEYALDYSKNAKGYDVYKITQVFDV